MRLDVGTDLQAEDEDGLVWAYLDDVPDPALVTVGALLTAGDERAAAVVQVVDLLEEPTRTIVRMRVLPGRPDEYAAMLRRAELAT